MDAILRTWAKGESIRAVVITSVGGKAFCAGGDVLALVRDGPGAAELRRDFFREEYRLNRLIHPYPKPFVPLVDGIVMGGGVGVSVHGSHRVATERVLFAMPETATGLFPDVGGSYFLPRLAGEIGTYLTLANARLKLADVVASGVYDAYVPSARLPALVDALVAAEWTGDPGLVVNAAISAFAEPPGAAELAPYWAEIDRCFAQDTIEGILDALDAEGSAFCARARAAIKEASPLMTAVALRQLRRGVALSFDDCMIMEYRLSRACMAGHDFFEAVRALLIDKNRRPQWRPASRTEVSEDQIEAFFDPLGDDDLTF